jgi:hypothetical protein
MPFLLYFTSKRGGGREITFIRDDSGKFGEGAVKVGGCEFVSVS